MPEGEDDIIVDEVEDVVVFCNAFPHTGWDVAFSRGCVSEFAEAFPDEFFGGGGRRVAIVLQIAE